MNLAEQYIHDIQTGETLSCKWVQLAVRRHLDDLETGAARGLRFDPSKASHVLDFFPQFCKHSKGEWAGKPLELAPWQAFLLWVLFGWERYDSETNEWVRRFHYSYLEVARKNGKTTLAAGLGLYLLDADGEPGAEIYAAATKKDQAKIAFDEAKRMVQASPMLSNRMTVIRDNISIAGTASKMEPLGRDADSLDGLNPHGCIVDELHAHKHRDLWDILDTATGARRSPLMFAITTAGYDRQSLCYSFHDYTKKILEGTVTDDTWFGLIFSLDDGDDWENESLWIKANPNLGISKRFSQIRDKADKAREIPANLNAFLRLELNVWTDSVSRWISSDAWDKCGGEIDETALEGRECYGGLDLSSTTDISAYVLCFPPRDDSEPYIWIPRMFIPDDNMRLRSKRDRVPYETWERQGLITATPGNVIDYEWILAQMEMDMARFRILEMAFDPWGSSMITQAMTERLGLEVIEFRQTIGMFASPMKELEKLILSGRLNHGGDPILAWMISNLVVRTDPSGNIRPDKSESIEKIDGIVAGIMALDRAIRNEGKTKESVYEHRGIREL